MEDKVVKEIKRHFDVVAEALTDKIDLLLEEQSFLLKKLETLNSNIDCLIKEDRGVDLTKRLMK